MKKGFTLVRSAGFTLIELLVVISIIAILSTIGLVTFLGTQAKARDSIRKNDLRTLATALELYQETNGKYLENPGSCADGPAPSDILYTDTNFKNFISGDLPIDPKTGANYCYESPGLTYKLYAKLENCDDSQIISGVPCKDVAYSDRKLNYSIVSDNLTITPAP